MEAACQKATNLNIFPKNRQTDRQPSKLIVPLQFIGRWFIKVILRVIYNMEAACQKATNRKFFFNKQSDRQTDKPAS